MYLEQTRHPLLVKADCKGAEWKHRIKMALKLEKKSSRYLSVIKDACLSDDGIVTTKDDSAEVLSKSDSEASRANN